ncbi:PQQ-dependent sugar dehydrogenase [Sneathiella glossodoripedis]|uniref:PQQ-dependent sugar dehydrogenase n=1 Tax=Sneathiella glossodoripedis TaxID=418853 RepID=UPI000687B183|nr:PQQ-dependent sugar dehydrogenase [Sneathiella glossodoripedis]
MNLAINRSVVRLAIFLLFCLSFTSSVTAENFNSRPPNATGQIPAFAEQTRAPKLDDKLTLSEAIIANGLRHPWGMAQLPDGGWLVTERPGNLRLVKATGEISKPIIGLPDVDARGQGGLLDIAIKEDFKNTHRIWWSYAEPRSNGRNATAVATGTLSEDMSKIAEVRVIFRQNPPWQSTLHFGSRLVFDKQGALFVTTGERSYKDARKLAQDTRTHIGKILRIHPDGGPAHDNPQKAKILPEIWSYGHRNIQSAALDQTGRLWTVEHGPRGGDELNKPEAHKNYGWPVITYGEEYSGEAVGDGITQKEGMEQPIYYWDPVIAPSGMTFYEGDLFPKSWNGNILIGGLAAKSLVRLSLKDDKVVGEARYLQGRYRIRDVEVGLDGAIYVLTDSTNGALLRLAPGN